MGPQVLSQMFIYKDNVVLIGVNFVNTLSKFGKLVKLYLLNQHFEVPEMGTMGV